MTRFTAFIPAPDASPTLGGMENTDTSTPPPLVPDDEIDSSDAAHRDRPPPSAPFYDWPDARADYLAGESAGVVAGRLGVSYRTVQRRAERDGWRRRDRKLLALIGGDGARHEEEALDPDSPMALFVDAHEYEVGELLLDPEPKRYIRYAFRRSAEAAARARPAEALVWARLVSVLDKVAPGVGDTRRAFNSADYARALYADKLRKVMEGETEEPEPDEPEGA